MLVTIPLKYVKVDYSLVVRHRSVCLADWDWNGGLPQLIKASPWHDKYQWVLGLILVIVELGQLTDCLFRSNMATKIRVSIW